MIYRNLKEYFYRDECVLDRLQQALDLLCRHPFDEFSKAEFLLWQEDIERVGGVLVFQGENLIFISTIPLE